MKRKKINSPALSFFKITLFFIQLQSKGEQNDFISKMSLNIKKVVKWDRIKNDQIFEYLHLIPVLEDFKLLQILF